MSFKQEGDRLSVEYHLTEADILAYYLYYTRSSPMIRRERLLALVGLPAIACALLLLLCLTRSFTAPESFWKVVLYYWYFWASIPIWVCLRLFFASESRRRRRFLKLINEGDRHLIGPRKVCISPEELHESSMFVEATTRWAAFEQVATTADYIYLSSGPTLMVAIPRRAFPDEETFRDFARTIQRYHRARTPGRCKQCGYDLTGNVSGKCPECGTSYATTPAQD